MSIKLNVPDLTELKPKITVIGIGGAGGNAVNNMITSGLNGVEFVAANTDAQALQMSSAEHRIQIGINLTEGLGAGSQPEIGEAAAEEALEELRAQIDGSHMVFVAAGMGGGTGTGAAPVIARLAHDQEILTVGVVTKPFHFEGQRRMNTAMAGIKELQKHVDTLIVIPNQNLFRIASEKTTFAEAFRLADQVLHSGIACITDLIVKEGLINLDFADVRSVMNEMGSAMMGTGEASGEKRALLAAEDAIANPLLDDVSMRGAKGLLISITGGDDLTLYEVDEAATRVREEVDPEANVIVGATFDGTLDGKVRVSIVASGVGGAAKSIHAPAQKSTSDMVGTLSERLSSVDSDQTRTQHPDQQPSQPTGRNNTWNGPGNVRIEQRPPKLPPLDEQRPQVGQAPPMAQHQPQQFAPKPPINVSRPPKRMPGMEDLPPIAQNELRAKSGMQPEVGIQAQKKKVGFFERLANVGRSSKRVDSSRNRENHSVEQRPSPMRTAENRSQNANQFTAVNKSGPQPAPMGAVQNVQRGQETVQKPASLESTEDIEIPAFFKRNSS